MKSIVAIGDLVLDIYHNAISGEIGYYVGGSVWNDILNLKKLDSEAKCFCLATCGNDWAGEFLVNQLNSAGVDTNQVKRINKQTKRFNIIVNGENTKSQLECPACERTIWYSDSKFPAAIPEYFNSIKPGIVIIDSVRKNIVELAKSFTNKGWRIAADIGHINHMRYMSKENLNSLLCGRYAIVQMTKRVYRFLLGRLGCKDEYELLSVLRSRYLNITDGENGSTIVFTNDSQEYNALHQEATLTDVKDPTGAGDAFFSMLLNQLDSCFTFPEGVENAIKKAQEYAADRVRVIGAHGVYEKMKTIDGDCLVCGGRIKKKSATKIKRQRIVTNTNYLLDRTLRALESDASIRIKEVLSHTYGNVVMVGTGGSYVAAEFAAKCVSAFHPEAIARACHPRDILIQGVNKTDLVFLFSYSGKTKDIQSVYEYCKRKGVVVYIITKYEYNADEKLYEEGSVISYSASKTGTKERGFISMAGTLIPMALFGEVYYHDTDSSFRDFLKDCFLRRSHEFTSDNDFFSFPDSKLTLDIFSGVDTVCAALDLESKFIESGLARVTIHEKKDFSHGRFNIIEKYTPNLVIFLDNVCGEYSKKLLRFLEKRDHIYICHIKSEFGSVWGDLDLVVAAEFFAKYISRVMDYDMAKPEYPSDGMSLYKYSRKDLL